MDDNRSQYRTRQGRRELLDVSLLVPGHPSAHGQILDLSYTGAGLRFNLDEVPHLRSGDDVELEFLSRGTGRRIICSSVVQYRREDTTGCRYGFQFVDSEELREHLDSGLMRLFNRRGKVRVRPCPTSTVAVELDLGESAVQGALLNISETGLSVRLPFGATEQLPDVDTVGLALALPGQSEPMRMKAILRYQTLEDTSERWGLEFEDAGSDNLEGVRTYVADRLRAITENRPHAA